MLRQMVPKVHARNCVHTWTQTCSLCRSPRLLSEISQTEVCTPVCHVMQQAYHTQNTPELLHRCLMPTNRARSVGVHVSLGLCTQRGFKVCRKPKNCSVRALRLICMCTVETLGAAPDELWNIQRGKNKVGKSLKHFRSHLEQNPTRDIGRDVQ